MCTRAGSSSHATSEPLVHLLHCRPTAVRTESPSRQPEQGITEQIAAVLAHPAVRASAVNHT